VYGENKYDSVDVQDGILQEVIMKMKYVGLIILSISLIIILGCPKQPKKVEMPPPPPVETTTIAETPEQPPEEPPVPPLQLSSIYFDYDKYDIRPDAQMVLSENGKSLTEHSTATIRIEGNCDERGTEQYNLALGEKRANSARDYLVNYGIEASRMTTISYGESRPVASGHNEQTWAKNRRDDFAIVTE
jgi:peptidoglycan-associated lipoprotein